MRDFILITKALSDETRVRIMKLLEGGELCVCRLMKVLEMGQSTVSKHLGILRMAGLVEARKEGTWSYYRLGDDYVNEYNPVFLKTIAGCLNEDMIILNDKKKLEEERVTKC
jgi:DNA-binding transcriptional ArsR family regulator